MGCADVCLDHGYDEINEFFSQRKQTARKQWQCAECSGKITPGERYEYSAGKCDGFMFDERTCLLCAEIRDAFVCGSFVFGSLWESIYEAIFPRWGEEGPYDCLMKLKSGEAKDFIQRQYSEWKAEWEDE